MLAVVAGLLIASGMCTPSAVVAQDATAQESPGQADLNAATSLKFAASSMADLERVIELAESAIEKGLEEEDEDLAKSLLTATLYQHGSRFAQALFDPRQRTERPGMLKQFALKDLYKILEYDETQPQVYMMISRLEAVAVQREQAAEARQKSIDAADKAIALLQDDPETLSKALFLRANYAGANSEDRITFLDRAIEADPENLDALRLRGKSRLVQGEMLAATGQLDEANETRQEAVGDFMKLLEANPDDPDALQSGAELLGRLGEFEKAMEYANQVIEQNPRVFTVYLLRARLHHKQQNYDEAIQDLNRAIDIQPANFLGYLERAEAYLDKGDSDAAAKDYGKARDLRGNELPGVIVQRMMLRSQSDLEKGIAEITKFMKLDELNAEATDRDPDPDFRLQLASTYVREEMPVEVIEILGPLIELRGDREYDGNTRDRNAIWLALQNRANSYLSIGQHKEAIDDYRKANAIIPDQPGVLNNLAWVLATSPNDELRDAKDAVKFAAKACELTQYKAAHILSTLAAAYADSGDFENALKYSQQAVEQEEAAEEDVRDEEMLTQLQKELESYKQEKPWREVQNVLEEKKADNPSGAGAEDQVESTEAE